jgi:hypothetical protein
MSPEDASANSNTCRDGTWAPPWKVSLECRRPQLQRLTRLRPECVWLSPNTNCWRSLRRCVVLSGWWPAGRRAARPRRSPPEFKMSRTFRGRASSPPFSACIRGAARNGLGTFQKWFVVLGAQVVLFIACCTPTRCACGQRVTEKNRPNWSRLELAAKNRALPV